MTVEDLGCVGKKILVQKACPRVYDIYLYTNVCFIPLIFLFSGMEEGIAGFAGKGLKRGEAVVVAHWPNVPGGIFHRVSSHLQGFYETL